MIEFTIYTLPIAQPRQRHRIATAGNGKMFSQNYTPKRDPVNVFKAALQEAAHKAYDAAPLEGPLAVKLLFVFPRPKGMMWKKREMPRVWHTKRPDVDNVIKAFKDAMNGLLWRDDSQVCQLEARKLIASGDEQPSVTVSVGVMGEIERVLE